MVFKFIYYLIFYPSLPTISNHAFVGRELYNLQSGEYLGLYRQILLQHNDRRLILRLVVGSLNKVGIID